MTYYSGMGKKTKTSIRQFSEMDLPHEYRIWWLLRALCDGQGTTAVTEICFGIASRVARCVRGDEADKIRRLLETLTPGALEAVVLNGAIELATIAERVMGPLEHLRQVETLVSTIEMVVQKTREVQS